MWQITKRLGGILALVVIVFGGLEVGLRTFPGELIPVGWLKRFQREVRVEIAQRLSLPNETQMWQLPRDDNGPPLRLYKGKARTEQTFTPDEQSNVTRDAQGFCNPPRDQYDRPSIDIIVMGDSFATCVAGNPEGTWVSRIGQLTGLSVFSLGEGGMGPYDYLQIFKYFGLEKNPKIVLMNIYEGNDLRDAVRYHEHVDAVRGGGGGYVKADDRFEPELDYQSLLDNALGRSSYAANLGLVMIGKAYEGVENVVLRGLGKMPGRVDFRYDLRFADGTVVPFNVQNADQNEVRYARRAQQDDVQLAVFDEALQRFAALGHEHDFRPVVAYAPSAYTTYADFVAFEDESLTELMPWLSRVQRDYLRQKAEELGIVFLDLAPALQEAARRLQADDLLYYPANVHYTPSGHQVVGDALAMALMALAGPRLSAD